MAHLRKHDHAGLFLDMGLGKTAITLSALEARHLPALVVAPKRVAENVWQAEAALWRKDLRVAVAAGRPQQRADALRAAQLGTADVVVVGRDNLADAVAHARHYRTFVMDELSSFKNYRSNRWKAAKAISRLVPHRWGLTGTPSPNGLLDLWAQLYLLDGGERLYNGITKFRQRYFYPADRLPNGVVTKWEIRPGADKRIMDLISDICLSMTAEGRIELPPMTRVQDPVPIPADARRMYRDMKRDAVVHLDIIGREGVRTAPTAAAVSNRLSQLTAGFMYPDRDDVMEDRPPRRKDGDYVVVHREKLAALQEIMDGTGSPVLVFYRFRAELDMIRKAFPDARTVDERGVLADWNRGEVPMLLAHPASAGHGLNLQHGGHTVVWTSLDWDLELWEQANARLHRQGQKHPVITHLLEVPKSIDGSILLRLEGKATIQDALMAHLESPL